MKKQMRVADRVLEWGVLKEASARRREQGAVSKGSFGMRTFERRRVTVGS